MTSVAGGQLRMQIATVPYPEVQAAAPRPSSALKPSFAQATLADIEFPAFSAGPLGQEESAWQPTAAAHTFGSPSRNISSDAAVFRSAASSTPLISMQLQDLQASVRRKDEMLQQLNEQIADMTSALNAQAIARTRIEEHEAEREAALAAAQAETSRLTSMMEAQQADLTQAKQMLKASAERTEANTRSARLELEELTALLSTVQRELADTQSDLALEKAATSRATTRAHESEQQMALLEKHNSDLTAQLKTNTDDSAYVAREMEGLQAQVTMKEEERKQAATAAAAQTALVDQLTAELAAQREDLAALPGLRRDAAALADLRAEHAMLRQSQIATQTELTMHQNLLAQRDEECAKMQTRITAQDESIRKLTASNTELMDERVDVSALRTQLSQSQHDLDAAKSSNKSLQTSNQSLKHSLDELETRQIPALKQRIMELEGIETRMKLDLDQRSRHLKQHAEQMRNISAKNPFNSRIDTAPKSNATGNAPTGVVIAVKEGDASSPSPSTGTAAVTADAESFSQLREQLNAQLLDLNARTRLAYGLLLDSERNLKHTQDALNDCKKQNIQLQKEAVESASESSERVQLLEQQLMQSQQELLITRSESQDSLAAASINQAQLSMLWQSCQLLHRAYRPLLARYRDVCSQKEYLSAQVQRFQCGTVRTVFDLRNAMMGLDSRNPPTTCAPATSPSALENLAPNRPHPYRLHSSRLSLRVAAIAVLAADRFRSTQGSEYGLMVSSGDQSIPVLQSNAFVLSAESKEDGSETQSRREREMLLPTVDDSTTDRAAASLIRLIEHFDSSAAYSAYSAPYPLLKRPNLSSRQSLLELLSNGHGFFKASRARRAPLTAAAASTPIPSTQDDCDRIFRVALYLAKTNKQLEQRLRTEEAEYVVAVEQSTRTQERLAQEQARALEIMQATTEEARQHESRNNDLIASLRASLAACEAERQQMVSRDQFTSLHHTSEMILLKCRELERDQAVQQSLLASLKTRAEQDQEELSEREMVIRGLQRTVEQKTLAITSLEKAQRNSNEEMQQVMSQLRQTQQSLLLSQQELVDARSEVQQLRITLVDVERHRAELSSTVDELNQELLHVKEVIRGVSHAHRMAELQDQPPPSAAQSQAIVPRYPAPSSSSSSVSRSTAYNPSAPLSSPLSSSIAFIPGSSSGSNSSFADPSTAVPAASAGPIMVRHHPNGNLSVDFGGGASLQHSAVVAEGSNADSNAMMAPVPYPLAASASAHRGLHFTPMSSSSSRARTSPRVTFTNDTK